MAHENKIKQFARDAGFEPLEGRCIIVQPAPDNLSGKIVSFFNSFVKCEMCVLQLCKNELLLFPFDPMWAVLQKDASLVLPYHNIRSVELADDLLNTIITIRTGEETIRLSAQQKELSDLRTSGLHATQYVGGYKNWHKENMDGTLKALTALGCAAG